MFPLVLAQHSQWARQAEAEIYGKPLGVGRLRQMSERCQGLFIVRRGLAERCVLEAPSPGLPTVGHGLVPHRAP